MQDVNVNLDSEVLRAGEEAQASGRLTPLIKIELWSKIQARRLSEGKEEMTVQFSPPQSTPLTEEEEEKSKNRKEKNKEAAQRCRERKKEKTKENEKELMSLLNRNQDLRQQVEELEEEILYYKAMLSVQETPASPDQQVPGLWTGEEDLLESFL
ncbi:uncharacterized protein LOC111131133 [Crassostrea virginica]|uniref:Cyclic AMP-dependent transcription factor ATF-3-like n=1 Tax=Crassostrea virginica TaxID=6565 RepID=A0A8B8E1W5_CRAVI|nr:cyclic AMP-dependent transcription factor ATF-3-like [Crassostrea virginica]XP_022334220.1 cyclic AMP-dependent transcription factor ATF-3-like [Crassostrea virginica]XP_022334227.1 cyclic AMP-dependent transcription factor ATF-3-like [Crassostrea virginica]XP_022334228.1 cyclic AMP-dependent transcription factor ATF-3-like [Crassostrea virginica]